MKYIGNFIKGVVSILYVYPVKNFKIMSKEEAWEIDKLAIYGDWEKVGQDLHTTIKKHTE